MLQEMRSAVSSLWIKILLGALVVSFVSFYGWRGGGGLSAGIVASVDGKSIRDLDLQLRLFNMLQYYRKQGLLQDDIPENLKEMWMKQVLTEMINQKLIVKEAHQIGLRVSPEQIRDLIQKQFAGEDGEFDFEFYKTYVRNRLKKKLGEFEEEQATSQLAMQYEQLLRNTTFTSTEELKLLYGLRNDRVSLSFVEIDSNSPPKSYPKLLAPTTAELDSYLKKHSSKYEIPEARKLDVAWYDWVDFVEPTETELNYLLRKKFPGEDDSAVTGERVHAAHILLRASNDDDKEMKKRAWKLYKKLSTGADFARIARAESQDSSRMAGGDLGYFGRGKMVAAFDARAFSMKPGTISKPIRTEFGYHIIKVIDRIPAGKRNVERLKPELVLEWKKDSLENSPRIEAFMKEAEGLLATFTKKAGSAEWKEVKKESPLNFAQTAFVSARDSISSLPEGDDAQEVLRKAQTLSKGEVSEPIRVPGTGHVFVVRVAGIQPARVPALATIRPDVSKDFKKERQEKTLRTFSQELAKKWNDSKESIQVLAKADGLTVQETGEFAREENNRIPRMGTSPEAMAEAFSRTAEKPFFTNPIHVGGKTFVAALKERVPPNWKLFDQQKESLRNVTGNETAQRRYSDWINYLRKNAEIEVAAGYSQNPFPTDG